MTDNASSTQATPTKTIDRPCASPLSKEKICLLCAKDIENISYRRKLVISGVKKTKACLNLELLLGKEFAVDDLPSNILCRNCADKNDKLVGKINAVRSQLESASRSFGEKGKITTSVKRLSRLESIDHTRKRALFETDSCSNSPKECEAPLTVVDGLGNEQESVTQVSMHVNLFLGNLSA